MRPFLTLHHPAAARRYYAEGLWREDTFYSLLFRHAGERPQVPALRDSRYRLTWSEILAWVDGVAADLAAQGLAGGDRVSIWLSSRIEAVIAFLACSRQGYACNPSLHRAYTPSEVAQLIDLAIEISVAIEHAFRWPSAASRKNDRSRIFALRNGGLKTGA